MRFILMLTILTGVIFGAITTLPFVLILLLCYSVVFKSTKIFVLAFFAGLYLDLILVRPLGQSSVFFLIFTFLLFLYDRKFEIQTVPFVFFAGLLGSIGYLLMFEYNYVFEQAVMSSIIAVLLFKLLRGRVSAHMNK